MNKTGIILIALLVVLILILTGCNSTTGEAKGGKPGKPDKPACSDGKDNDGDNLCDYTGCYIGKGKNKVWYASDSGCDSEQDNDEYNAYCGDGSCYDGETCLICPADCGDCLTYCGDSDCNGNETCATCSQDCGTCQELDSCSDTDGGHIYVEKGTVSGYLNNQSYSKADYCLNNVTLTEHYCLNNKAYDSQVPCINISAFCSDGKCI